jgi:DNA-binding response OmpR family regulator
MDESKEGGAAVSCDSAVTRSRSLGGSGVAPRALPGEFVRDPLHSARGRPVPRILVVSAEPESGDAIGAALGREGFEVVRAAGASEAVELAASDPPDALVVDTWLRDRSGFAVCRSLRESDATREVPVLMLTPADSELDNVLAFEAGADDAVRRPFYPRELALRVRALLRRRRIGRRLEDGGGVVACGPLRLDATRRAVRAFGHEATLGEIEFAIVAFLAQSPGRVFPRDEIVRAVWGADATRTARLVDAHVKSIRRKLGDAGACVESVRGIGYRISEKAE